jgi:hypothetical protein
MPARSPPDCLLELLVLDLPLRFLHREECFREGTVAAEGALGRLRGIAASLHVVSKQFSVLGFPPALHLHREPQRCPQLPPGILQRVHDVSPAW